MIRWDSKASRYNQQKANPTQHQDTLLDEIDGGQMFAALYCQNRSSHETHHPRPAPVVVNMF